MYPSVALIYFPALPVASDSEEVANLYRRYGPAVHRRVLSMVRDPQEALDLTQETFLAYMKARPTLRGEAAPFTLLYQIATCQAVDRLRKRARWTGRLGAMSVEEEDDRAAEAEV
ncbi:MAG: RNA polymerase sigma factor, partial [Myxococcaceae bacterium]